ncbi:MAG: low molecular weight protein-tyrosine-phosphatase [Saprospiraceae bacterium]|nr:low molecular weight phosphotyrosine protein phosphatase [Saprospiraceae bacterium]MCB9344883.1 low molecular weight phosphotyrosine protein phosphatase [Lewinellaceae bacterium]
MRILMVCLGNICRSPLAEGIMKSKVAQNGLNWTVDSAGTGGWHSGELPDPRSRSTARQHGIDISDQRARQFRPQDFDDFDRIFVMDSQNFRDVIRQARNESDSLKVSLMLEESHPGENRSVPDPYYDDDGFEQVYQMLDDACHAFVERNIRV